MNDTATWLAERTASLLPRILPGHKAAASCTTNYWLECGSYGYWLCSLEHIGTEYSCSSCGGVIGCWSKAGCC